MCQKELRQITSSLKCWCWNNHEHCLIHFKKYQTKNNFNTQISLVKFGCAPFFFIRFGSLFYASCEIQYANEASLNDPNEENNRSFAKNENYVINYDALHEPCLTVTENPNMKRIERRKKIAMRCRMDVLHAQYVHSWECGRVDLNFHWLKFVKLNRNIIYLLNMPSNNVTLFHWTFCWFFFRFARRKKNA